jgi:hypothetical protein
MSDIITERTGGILRVEFNRPQKKNAMTGGMYTSLADILNEAAEDEHSRCPLAWRWRGVPRRQRPPGFPPASAQAR